MLFNLLTVLCFESSVHSYMNWCVYREEIEVAAVLLSSLNYYAMSLRMGLQHALMSSCSFNSMHFYLPCYFSYWPLKYCCNLNYLPNLICLYSNNTCLAWIWCTTSGIVWPIHSYTALISFKSNTSSTSHLLILQPAYTTFDMSMHSIPLLQSTALLMHL